MKMLSEREADEVAYQQHGEVLTWSSESEVGQVPIRETSETQLQSTIEAPQHATGKNVAKDLGSQGVFVGEVISVEYDSSDESKAAPYYVVKYSDGDQEDLNEEEFQFAHELSLQIALDAEESYRLSLKVIHFFITILLQATSNGIRNNYCTVPSKNRINVHGTA